MHTGKWGQHKLGLDDFELLKVSVAPFREACRLHLCGTAPCSLHVHDTCVDGCSPSPAGRLGADVVAQQSRVHAHVRSAFVACTPAWGDTCER